MLIYVLHVLRKSAAAGDFNIKPGVWSRFNLVATISFDWLAKGVQGFGKELFDPTKIVFFLSKFNCFLHLVVP
jgi:hypothetical protein